MREEWRRWIDEAYDPEASRKSISYASERLGVK